MKKISIIIPFFNAEPYLPTTIKCLKKQTLKDIEIVLVNDGSTDNSLKICYDLTKGDRRFRIITQENKGVSAARNVGIENSSGEYYLFLDADDIYDNDMCECIYNIAKKENADLTIYGIKIQEFDGKIHYMNNTNVKEIWSTHKAITEFFTRKKINVGVHTKLFSKTLIEQLRFEDGKKINEDKFFLFQSILLAKKIIYYDQCKYLYIRRKGSASNSSYHPKYKDAIYFSKKILNEIQREYPAFYITAYKDLQNARLFTFRKLCKNKENKYKYKSDYDELKAEIKGSDLSQLKGYKIINILETIVIKYFGDLYYYIISMVYKNKY